MALNCFDSHHLQMLRKTIDIFGFVWHFQWIFVILYGIFLVLANINIFLYGILNGTSEETPYKI